MVNRATKTPPMEPKEAAIALKGLAPTVTEQILHTMYRTYGAVQRIKVDGQGGAHVVFKSRRASERAALATNGALVQGQAIVATKVLAFTHTNRPCRGFQAGICRHGDKCKYMHIPDGTDAKGTGSTATTATPTIKAASKKVASSVSLKAKKTAKTATSDVISKIPRALICRNFSRGSCASGSSCRYAHVVGTITGTQSAPVVAPPTPPTPIARTKCTYYAGGLCRRGDDCAFLHEDAASKSSAKQNVTASTSSSKQNSTTTPAKTKTKSKTKTVVKSTANATIAKPVTGSSFERTCTECENAGIAVWKCASCEQAEYCDACDAAVHRVKVMRSHERVQLPPTPTVALPKCGECETEDASVTCLECEVAYCASCEASVHRFKSLRQHTRSSLDTSHDQGHAVASTEKPHTYIESVPKYELSSSESSSEQDDEDEGEDKDEGGEEVDNEEEEEDEAKPSEPVSINTVPSVSYIESVPKYELSSESDSSSDEEEDEISANAKKPIAEAPETPEDVSDSDSDTDDDDVRPVVTNSTVPTVTLAEMSSESSDDDDFQDERPSIVTATTASTPTPAAPTQPKVPVLPPPPIISSDSSDSSDSDYDNGVAPSPMTAKSTAVKRKATSSSSSSSPESEDDDDDEKPQPPPSKQQRTASPPVHNHTNGNGKKSAKPSISADSSHSVVKKIETYHASADTHVLHLDANLNGFERLLAHDCAERLGLAHVSVGEGIERHITVFRGPVGGGAPSGATGNGNKKRKLAGER